MKESEMSTHLIDLHKIHILPALIYFPELSVGDSYGAGN